MTVFKTNVSAKLWTEFDRAHMALMITKLLDHWQLSIADSLILLGLSPYDESTLDFYRNGGSLAPSRDLVERVAYLISINELLDLLFPTEISVSGKLMTTPNQKFSGQTPVEVIDQHGFVGLIMIKNYLESMVIR